MTISLEQLVVWLLIGAVAGYIAGTLLRGRGYGTLGNMLIGLVGAVIGGVIFSVLGIDLQLPEFTFRVADLLVATVGAIILILLVRLITSRR